MKLLEPSSLAATVDAVNEWRFLQAKASLAERRRTADWIASRQGQKGAYRGKLFAPTEEERSRPLQLFSGEKIATKAGARHILGQEAARAILLLSPGSKGAQQALANAQQAFVGFLSQGDRSGGRFCCGKCSCSVLRHLAAGPIDGIDPDRWIVSAVRTIKSCRQGNGRWRVFPFHYTLLSLCELDHPAVRAELKYAAPACEKIANRAESQDRYANRRRLVARRVLEACG